MAKTYTKEELAEAVKHLEAAHKYLSKESNWIKNNWQEDHRVCSLGALERITGQHQSWIHNDTALPAMRFLACAVASSKRPVTENTTNNNLLSRVATWNDKRETTHAVLLAGWEKAIELARKARDSAKKEF